MNNIILENKTMHLEFDPATGALVKMLAVESDWELLNRPHLGLSFRLMVPFPKAPGSSNREVRNNQVFGEQQKLTSVTVSEDQKAVTFIWDGVDSNCSGRLDIKVLLDIKVTERQAIYSMTIENRSEYTVENVYCPYIGDVQHPPEEKWFKSFAHVYANAGEHSLWPTFDDMYGGGSDYPTQYTSRSNPRAPFMLLRGEKQGLYLGTNKRSLELIGWHTELHPGYSSAMETKVPKRPTIDGKDVFMKFAAVHVPFIEPDETRTLTPMALEIFQGGWQHGADIHKKWINSWIKKADTPAWANEPDAWLQIHINSPESELRIKYKDLVKVGEECARHGIKAIQLTGWTLGGQDQDNPSHDIDPRLGTAAELKNAISSIQKMGIKVILFAKFTWADRSTKRFRNELIEYSVKDPYGDYYQHPGWKYMSASQLMDISTKRLIPMCFLSKKYLQICDEEFRKTLDLGADGILFDECHHHAPALLCFDNNHGHRIGASVYGNDLKLIENFSEISKKINKEYLFAGEACYDPEFEVYHLSYHRSGSINHIPLSRYLLPDVPLMTAINGFNDRNMVNQCLMYRYIISYEPYNFKGHPDDYPLTIEYGKKMDALRKELRDYFWDGEFREKIGASVTVDGKPQHPFSVFTNKQNGKSGLVICNYNDNKSITVSVTMDNGNKLNRYRLVDNPEWVSVESGIHIPPESAVVVI